MTGSFGARLLLKRKKRYSPRSCGMGGDSMSKGSMGDMKSKPMMMKKHKMMHHSMHRGMMKKPMTSGGGM